MKSFDSKKQYASNICCACVEIRKLFFEYSILSFSVQIIATVQCVRFC